ncbi:MAG: PQQ-binding-like beta-propeller repeat protein [Candidatus Latescibacteria bacterium]|nr:PQQ-binding-like beta-propeller repeat protein [Candidatus Latescibacterota bacterium]
MKRRYLFLFLLFSTFFRDAEGGEGRWLLRWKRLFQPSGSLVVTLSDSLIYTGSVHGEVTCLRSDDGTLLWRYGTGGAISARLVTAGDLILVGGEDGTVSALHRFSGHFRWRVRGKGAILGNIVVSEEMAVVPDAEGRIYAINLNDGAILWRVKAKGRVVAAPVVDDERVYFGAEDGVLRVVDRNDGMPVWDFTFTGALLTPPLLYDHLLYLATGDGYLYAIEARTGSKRWVCRTGSLLRSELLYVHDRHTLISGWSNRFIYAIGAEDGKVLWTVRLEDEIDEIALDAREPGLLIAGDGGVIRRVSLDGGGIVDSLRVSSSGRLSIEVDQKTLYVNDLRGYLYCFTPEEVRTDHLIPEKTGTDHSSSSPLWDYWTEEIYKGTKVGYTHVMVGDTIYDGVSAFVVRDEEVSWDGGYRRSITEAIVDRQYRPLAFERRRTEDDQAVILRGKRGERDRFIVEQGLAGGVSTEEVVLDPATVYPIFAERRALLRRAPTVGRKYTEQILDLSTLRSVPLVFEVVSFDTITVGMKHVPTVRLRIDYETDDLKRLSTEEVVTYDGRLLMSYFEVFHWETRVVPKADALAWTIPPYVDTIGVDVDLPPRWETLERFTAQFTLRAGEVNHLFPSDSRQTVALRSLQSAEITSQRLRYDGQKALPPPIRGKETDRFLKPTLYIQSDHPRIRALARSIVGSERNSWRAAIRLMSWVYNNMSGQETNVSFKSALEVLDDMEGTCSEYSVLFIALARASGIPSRAVVGLLPTGERTFGLHMWSQVYVGKWIDLDPSWNQTTVDAVHIKMAESTLAFDDLLRLNVTLQLVLSQLDTIRVVSYDAGIGPVLIEAERLFEKASQAEREMRDEEAMRFLQQIGEMPINLRTDDALEQVGEIYLRAGQREKATEIFQRVISDYPTSDTADDAMFRRARIEEEADHLPDALELLNDLVERFPDSDLADDALCYTADIYEKHFENREMAAMLYRRVTEEYVGTGWAIVAKNWLAQYDGRQ